MKLDDRLHAGARWLDEVASDVGPDLADLDRRQARQRARSRLVAVGSGVGVLALLVVTVLLVSSGGGSSVPAAEGDPTVSTPPPATIEGDAFVLARLPGGLTPVAGEQSVDLRGAFDGEEFTEVYVDFSDDTSIGGHLGGIAATIRLGVGVYDESLRQVYAGRGERVMISDREFDLIEVDTPSFRQLALVPVDISDRTFLLTGRDVDAATLIEMAQPIDPMQAVPRIGPAPDEFVQLHSGRPEFPSLADGVAVTYRSADRELTVATYDGVGISCFSYAWVFANAEITSVGGDAGVVAQLSGRPGGLGEYRVLWNRDFDTLIGFSATGFTREELIDLADDLVFDDTPDALRRHDLEFAF